MRQDRHYYEYLYNSLVMQIECGLLMPGGQLPSQSELCREYNAGITTVRKVIRMLSAAGYVHSSAGRRAKITFQGTPESYAACLLRRRAGISDAFRGLGVLMPPLYTEGARRCTPADLNRLQAAIHRIKAGATQAEVYHHARSFFTALLRPFHSALVMDLEADAENFLQVPDFPFLKTREPFRELVSRAKSWLESAFGLIESGSYDLLGRRIRAMYSSACTAANQYMDSLENIAAPEEQATENRLWFVSRGHSELYAELAMSLLRRIAVGEFKENQYLPSIPELMRQYGVVKDTASRALSFLNLIGAVRTLDKKGTVIAGKNKVKRGSVELKEPLIRRRVELFLDAMQIMVVTARANAGLIFPLMEEQHIRQLEEKLDHAEGGHINSIAIQVIVGHLIRLSPYYSLRNIYEQLNQVMLWGYYLEAAGENLHFAPETVGNGVRNYIEAVKTGDRSAFLNAMEFTFSEIYGQARTAFLASGGE